MAMKRIESQTKMSLVSIWTVADSVAINAICFQQTSNRNQCTLELSRNLPWLALAWTQLRKLLAKTCQNHPKSIAAPVPVMRKLLTNKSSIRRDSGSTAQNPFEIFEAELPGTSLEPRGKEARPPPGAPGLWGAARGCWGCPKYPGGRHPVWPSLCTATREDCTDCICAQKAQLKTNNGHEANWIANKSDFGFYLNRCWLCCYQCHLLPANIKQKSMHFGAFKALAMTCFGMNANLGTFGQNMPKPSQEHCCTSSCHEEPNYPTKVS